MLMNENIDAESYNYFVPIPEECRNKIWTLMDWLGQFKDDCVILYHQYSPSDGQWHTGSQSIPAFVGFKNEEDAVAFKLRWI